MSDVATEVPASPMTPEEYFAFDDASEDRWELVNGLPRLMAGASWRHNVICLNLSLALRAARTGTNCQVFMEGVRLKVGRLTYFYPDVMVTCEVRGETHAMSEPCLVAEVLSPTTTARDRSEKSFRYFQLPTLRHVLFVDPETRVVEHHHRASVDDPWVLELAAAPETDPDEDPYTGASSITVGCPGPCTITLAELFADTE